MPLAWPFVEFAFDIRDLFISDGTKVSPFGKVVTDEPVGVLVAAPLPRVVRMSEEALRSCRRFDWSPVTVLWAVVERDGAASARWKYRESSRDRRSCRVTGFAGEFRDEDESGLSLHERVDTRLVIPRFHGVTLPISDTTSSGDDLRTIIDRRA